MNNSTGEIFRLTTFGESHGEYIGGIIDGCPSNLELDLNFIQFELNRRRPGQSNITTQRNELDKVKFLSGIINNITTGTPIGFIIKNTDQKSQDYNNDIFRPSHADYTYNLKYKIKDYKGGGRSSARETACRVVAGAIAKLILNKENIKIKAYVSQVGKIKLNKTYKELDLFKEENIIRCPDEEISKIMIDEIEKIKKKGDSVGGIITCVISNMKSGLGDPIFNKLQSKLANVMLSINACKGFEYGSGFNCTNYYGSEHNDEFYNINDKIITKTNFSGGIQGGISNGEDIYFNVAFKPTSTILIEQNSIDSSHNNVKIKNKGRHDPCILPRAVPIVESMASLVLVDSYLKNKIYED